MKSPPAPLWLAAALAVILFLGGGSTARSEILLDMVLVGNAGNAADVAYGGYGPYGAVAYEFAIGKYEITNFQYASFLNAVATVSDPYALYPATDNPGQFNNPRNVTHAVSRGIVQTPLAGGGFSYSLADNMADKPANFITWFSAARFANWLANGQPTGAQDAGTTENGAYALLGAMSANLSLTRNAINPNTAAPLTYWLPSEDEWYKAAFYDPVAGGGEGAYWLYPTRSMSQPVIATATATGDIANPGTNVANYSSGVTWNGLNQNLTTAGSAGPDSASSYGTLDQAGNVWEWSEGVVRDASSRGLRQGSANDPAVGYLGNTNDYMAASWSNNGQPPDRYFWNAGIRIAGIPEPSVIGLLLACATAWGARHIFKRNKRLAMWLFALTATLLAVSRSTAAPEPVADAIEAAARGDAAWLCGWLAAGGNPDQPDAAGWTPLLTAAARGKAEAVSALLNNPSRKADPGLAFAPSGALPIHMAGQSGNVETARVLLDARPSDLDAVWLLNGHTLLLQAAFYGHVDLAGFALKRGANPSATTLRGLTALDFAHQFDNRPLIEVLAASPPDPDARDRWFQNLLAKIRQPVPPGEDDARRRSDAAAAAIAAAIASAGAAGGPTEALLASVVSKLDGVDVNLLAGDLQQPLLVVAVTGSNPGPHPESAAALRLEIARALLDRNASPLAKELHPMGAHAIIRASVFGHLEILRLMGEHITASELAGALNEIPAVNGLTALHDAVLRSATAPDEILPRYLDQIRWETSNGARSDIGDFSGRTQRQYAENIADPTRRKAVLDIFDSAIPLPQWNHPALAVPCLEPAMKWYADIFGFAPIGEINVQTPAIGERWKIADAIFGSGLTQLRLVRMRVPDAPYQQVIELFELTPPPPAPEPASRRTSGYVHACVIVGDPDTTAGRVAARGGKILSRTPLGDLTIIFCHDPYGNIIELASRPW